MISDRAYRSTRVKHQCALESFDCQRVRELERWLRATSSRLNFGGRSNEGIDLPPAEDDQGV
jgi:hypothetical protein